MTFQDRGEVIFEFIARTYQETGVPPTAREIAAGTDVPIASIHYQLQKLVRLGRLTHSRRKYLPADPKPVLRGVASCPWGETAHDYVEALRSPLAYCRKCGSLIELAFALSAPLQVIA